MIDNLWHSMREFWLNRAERHLDRGENARAVVCLRLAALDGRTP